jgi:dUTP pyrophosphatase
VDLPVKRLRSEARLPERAYPGDAAFDLHAAVDVVIAPQERAVVPTGIALGLPPGVAALTLPRSGLATRHGVTIVNAPGLIDPGYRGEVQVILLNTDCREPFAVHAGDRIAQLLLVGLLDAVLLEVADLDATARGARGFGSSGTTVKTTDDAQQDAAAPLGRPRHDATAPTGGQPGEPIDADRP